MQEPVVTGERPLVQSVVRALARLWRRPLWLAGLIVILSVPLWLAARPWVTQRVLCFDFTPAGAGLQWVVEWERGSDGLKNGAWLDLPRLVGGTETLEIRPSGQPHEAGRSFEFWLYSVTPSRGPASSPDLKALVERPSDESLTGRWVLPPPAVPGIVYAGNQPGSLKLDLPPGNVTIAGAKTETGGGVEFRYADDSVTVDTYASPDQPLTVQLKRQTVPEGRVLQVRRPLPNYALSRVMLSWYDSPAARFSLENVKVQETIFGRRVRARSITPVAAQNVADAGRDGRAFRFVTSSTAGTVLFPMQAGLGSRVNTVGYGLTLAVLLGLAFGVPLVVRLVRCLPRWTRSFEAVALGVVAAAHVWMAVWAPFVFVPDSLDYVHSSMAFLATGSLEHIHPGRVPGLAVFVAPFIAAFSDFGAALGWAHACLGILSAVLAYGMLKPFAPQPWPGLAMLAVGLNPLGLMYERLMLSECLAAFCAMLTGWMLVQLATRNASGRLSWPAGILLAAATGLAGGLAPYVRGNLQMMIVLGPVVLLISCWRRPRRARVLVQAVILGAVGAACLLPWIVRNARICGRAEFIVGRHYQRLEEASQLGCQFADDNQTLAFDYEDWRRIRDQLESQSRYALPAELFNSRLRRPEVPEQHHAVLREQICRPVIDESFARQPLRALRGMAAALATQLGLWNKFPQSRAENAYWSLPLRGVLRDNSWSNTNFICDVDPLAGAGPEAAWKQDLARRVRHDISYVVDSPNAQLFNEWFWAHRFVAPLLAVLFLVGLGWSLWNGQYPLFGLGLFVLANALALAILVVSNVERYSVPFGGLLLLLATHGMYALTRFRHRGGQGA